MDRALPRPGSYRAHIPVVQADALDLDHLELGSLHRFRVRLVRDGLGDYLAIPVIVAQGREPGPVLGVTAAVHGNELNGIPVIQRLMAGLDVDSLCGTVVAVPIVNLPGYQENRRELVPHMDLNRLFPGRPDGNVGQIYAHRFVERVIRPLHYLIDMHTASFGRVNSLYVRADMRDPATAEMARLQSPQIIVHNEGGDGTLRSAAADLGIPAITVEVGDPQRFQLGLIRSSLIGVRNVLCHFGMIPQPGDSPALEPVFCRRSYWMYTDRGGVLEVFPRVADQVRKGELVARVTNIFGDVVREYTAPESGIVIGKSTNPVNQAGSRILHLGIPGELEVRPRE
ncbi:MAG: succinylglutamate desuccinylase/aspartoacylase family protein [Nannocystaceae bacterium]|nr:succinylglutamate desuccinylase/aspartoacylase family protein [Myxococcales bacterium]